MYEYFYAWRNNEKRQSLYKRACRVVARGRMNSCLIEFENGQRECVSRNAVKRLTQRPLERHNAMLTCAPGKHKIGVTGMTEENGKIETPTSERASGAAIVMPPIPSKWYSRKYGTRHVVDRTMGWDVVYIQGRMPRDPFTYSYHQKHCTLQEWGEYQKTAKMVSFL